jgi:hypothetical protein
VKAKRRNLRRGGDGEEWLENVKTSEMKIRRRKKKGMAGGVKLLRGIRA